LLGLAAGCDFEQAIQVFALETNDAYVVDIAKLSFTGG
jgi:hypothetical protein